MITTFADAEQLVEFIVSVSVYVVVTAGETVGLAVVDVKPDGLETKRRRRHWPASKRSLSATTPSLKTS